MKRILTSPISEFENEIKNFSQSEREPVIFVVIGKEGSSIEDVLSIMEKAVKVYNLFIKKASIASVKEIVEILDSYDGIGYDLHIVIEREKGVEVSTDKEILKSFNKKAETPTVIVIGHKTIWKEWG
jgi:hypothetical protein